MRRNASHSRQRWHVLCRHAQVPKAAHGVMTDVLAHDVRQPLCQPRRAAARLYRLLDRFRDVWIDACSLVHAHNNVPIPPKRQATPVRIWPVQ